MTSYGLKRWLIAGGWEKTGLALPASCQVRARARVTSGSGNGSSGLVQTVMAGVLRALFTDALRAVRGQPLPDLASHALLLAAVHLLYRTSPRDFGLARDALQTLRSRAPTHAAPLAWLARWHLTRVVLR